MSCVPTLQMSEYQVQVVRLIFLFCTHPWHIHVLQQVHLGFGIGFGQEGVVPLDSSADFYFAVDCPLDLRFVF